MIANSILDIDSPAVMICNVMYTIHEDNQRFVEQHDMSHFEPFFNEQHPRATIVGCCDSRFQTNSIDENSENDLFIIRNIGNQIDTAQGSIEYGVYHLKTPVLMIIGHSNCGAIKAVMEKKSHDTIGDGNFYIEDDILRELKSVMDYKTENNYLEIEPQSDLNENVKRNIINQVNDATKLFSELVDKGELLIVGAFYDFTNSHGEGYGKLVEIVRSDDVNYSHLITSDLV